MGRNGSGRGARRLPRVWLSLPTVTEMHPWTMSSRRRSLAEEARQLPAKLHQQAQQQLQQQYSTESRGCLLTLAVGVAIVGPFLAILFLMGGDLVPVLATVVGSCALAGLLLAAVSRGIRGALAVLGLPLIWLVSFVGLELWSGIRSVPSADETLLYLGVFLLIQAASAEAGYLIGRLVAGLRRLTSAPSAR